MTKKTNLRVIAAAVALGLIVSASPAEAGGNSWGWSKPLNQRMGLLYTSNQAFHKKSTSKRSRIVTGFNSSNHISSPSTFYAPAPVYHSFRYYNPVPAFNPSIGFGRCSH